MQFRIADVSNIFERSRYHLTSSLEPSKFCHLELHMQHYCAASWIFFSTKHGKAPPGHSASSKPLLATLGVVAACGAVTKRTKVTKVKCRAKMRPEEEDELSLGKERNRWKQTWNTKINSNTWLYSAIRKDKAGEASRKSGPKHKLFLFARNLRVAGRISYFLCFSFRTDLLFFTVSNHHIPSGISCQSPGFVGRCSCSCGTSDARGTCTGSCQGRNCFYRNRSLKAAKLFF